MSTFTFDDRHHLAERGHDRRQATDRRVPPQVDAAAPCNTPPTRQAAVDHYTPLSAAERSAVGVVALLLCLALTSGVALLFQRGDAAPGWAGLLAPPAGMEPSCPAADPRAAACQRQVARSLRDSNGATTQPLA